MYVCSKLYLDAKFDPHGSGPGDLLGILDILCIHTPSCVWPKEYSEELLLIISNEENCGFLIFQDD